MQIKYNFDNKDRLIEDIKKLQDYDDHLHGVYQGDILSPLLSNIYLNEMDTF